MTALTFIDEHSRHVDAPPAAAWDAARAVVDRSFDGSSPVMRAFARKVVQAQPAAPAGPRPLQRGSDVVGFEVVDAVEGERLALEGRHRFSRYRLELLVGPDAGGSCVRALTFAEFPGARGWVYRALVIGSRAHVVAVRRILGAAARRAERR